MKKYGKIAIAILEEISDLGTRVIVFAEAALTVDARISLYPALERRFHEIMCEEMAAKERSWRRRKFYQTLYRLKKDGIVTQYESGILGLTERGEKILRREGVGFQGRLPSPSIYAGVATAETTVVIFDIPEAHREKRAWLRSVIKNLGFSMVQKSVWIGNVGIPPALLANLQSLSLLSYVKFFTVTKQGTLRDDC